jgi:MFS family permease
MTLSGLCAVLIGFTFGASPALTLAVAILWGITIIADSAQFSTCVTELSPHAYVGTTLTMQTCVGFALTTISIWIIPLLVAAMGWRWAFSFLAVGPLFGVMAMSRLRALPESLKLAGGRR